MRRTRLGDVTGAVTDVGDGGDLEGVPFLPPAPAPRLTDAAAVESPAQNAAAGAVGPTGATPDQVRQALNATNLGFTGAGFTVGVLSDSFDFGRGGGGRSQARCRPPRK